jgi:hypothetical protein
MTAIEQELRLLEVDFPAEPDLTGAVLGRIERRRRPVWLVPALAALAVAGALMAIPQTRAAILDFFRIGGVGVERVDTQPAPPTARPVFGERVDLDEAQEAVDFPLLVPRADAVVRMRGPLVELTFGRLTLLQFRGEQLPYVTKQVGPSSSMRSVMVRGANGVWIDGARHEVIYRLPSDVEPRFVQRRAAGNVLIWEDDGVTYRLEGPQTLADALRVARDLRRG